MKKIIHFVKDLAPSSGVTRVVESLVTQGANENLQCTIILTDRNSRIKEFDYPNIDLAQERASLFGSIISPIKFIKYVIINRKEIIFHMHTVWDPVQSFFLVLGRLIGIYVVCSTHGMLMKESLEYSKLKKSFALNLYLKGLLKKFDKIHVTSDLEESGLSSLRMRNIVKLPLGVYCKPLDLEWQTRRNILLFMSRVHPIKGVENLLHAWCGVNNKDWTLLIAGPGEKSYLQYLKTIIQQYSGERNIVFHEEVDSSGKDQLFKISKIFILPSKSENFGLVIPEALSAGLPVIVSRNTPWNGIEKFFCGWSTGISISELKQTLENVLNTADNETRLKSESAIKYVDDNYNWEKIYKLYMQNLYGL